MLIIRAEQLQVLSRLAARQYRERTAAFLRAEAREVFEDASEQEVDDFIRHGLDRAASHGIVDRHYARQFLLFMAWVGPDFDAVMPWARAILSAPDAPESEKVARLEGYILTEWEGSTPCP